MCARGRDRAPAAAKCKGGYAAAPSARLALAFGGRLCQRQPRAQADRPPPEVARAGCAVRDPPASIKRGGLRVALCAARKPGYLLGACHGCNVGTARRAVMLSTRPGVRPRDSRRARCARWPEHQQRHRAAPTRPGLLIESNLRGYSRRCRCRAGIQGAAAPRLCCQLAANLGRCPSPRPAQGG